MLYTLAKEGKKQKTVLKLPVCMQLGIALPFSYWAEKYSV